jgi:hypothetical protein
MNVTEYAEVLRNPALSPYEDSWYTSHTTGRQGYRAVFRLGKRWYWYSVSNVTAKVSPLEVADAITSPSATIDRSGPYKETGFESTVRFDGHSYMLNEGDGKP